jgi:hypothetical protein
MVTSTDVVLIKQAIELISKFPKLLEDMPTLPNINFPTMGGQVFWNNLAEANGWRVQKNNITGHCRILDSDDVRRAWGGEEAIMNFFTKILKE